MLCFQMRPDIKKDVFHLCWAPEKLPPDEVSIDLVIGSVFIYISRVPVEGKSSVCLICMKYRIIITLIIIIISLGEILLSYIANTSRMHAHTHAHTRIHARTHTHTHRYLRSGSMHRWRPSVTKLTPLFACSAGIHGR